MTGLLGWMGGTSTVDNLAVMAQAAGGSPALVEKSPDGRALLAAWLTHDAGSVHQSEGVIAAIVGTARWDVQELHRLAEQAGMAASLVEAYRRYGSDFLEHLHGAFAVAVLDMRNDPRVIRSLLRLREPRD